MVKERNLNECQTDHRIETSDPEPDDSSKRTNKRSVRFEEGDKLVSAVFKPLEPWTNVERLNQYELAGAYTIRCEIEGLTPLYSVLAQLQNINLKESFSRRPSFQLKGTQLNAAHVETLEEVFKRVQFELLNLENTNLNDDSLVALCDMLEFYDSCTEFCLARNCVITNRGWKAVGRLIRKLPCLKWLDLRGTTLTDPDLLLLAGSIRSQAMSCRTGWIRAYNSNVTAEQNSPEASPQLYDTGAPDTPVHQLCFGLTGLHMGSTGLRDLSFSRFVHSVRLSAVCDLRLPDNRLDPSDAVSLVPLLRYGASLRYLDLSRNKLGDAGCKVIAEALATTAFAGSATTRGGLSRLDLSENQLTFSSMDSLSNAVASSAKLRCLQLAGNPQIGCTGLLHLQPGLLHCRQLKRLGLASCGVRCVGMVALAEVVVDKPRQLNCIELHANPIGPAGLLALARCLNCVDRRVRIVGLDLILPLADMNCVHGTVTPIDSTPPHCPMADSDSLNSLQQESLDIVKRALEENAANYHHTGSVSTRYSALRYPNSSHEKSPSSTGSLDALDLQHEPDPRYLWGDSSDEENVIIEFPFVCNEDEFQDVPSPPPCIPDERPMGKTSPPPIRKLGTTSLLAENPCNSISSNDNDE